MIVIKRITKAEEYDNRTLRDTCVFHALRRADESGDVDALGGHQLEGLRSKDAVRAALREGRTVFAVYQGTIEMPVIIDGVKPVGSGNSYVAAARILVRLNVGREFDSWVRQQFSNPFRRKFSDAKLVRSLIVSGIGNDFRTLFNKEKEELLLKYGINSTDFPELGDHLRGWCRVVKVLAFQPELSSTARSGFFIGIKAEIDRILKPTSNEMLLDVLEIWRGRFFNALKLHPFRVLLVGVLIAASVIAARGCLKAYARKEAEQEHVSGSVELSCLNGAGDAANLLRSDAETHIAEAFKKHGVVWASGREAELRRDDWANLFGELRAFVNESGGEFSFRLSEKENRAFVLVHPEKVKSFTFDVTALNDRAEYVSKVARAFGVTFAGRNVVGPKPIRKRSMDSALKALKGSKVKVDVKGSSLMFMPDYSDIGRGTFNMPNGLTPQEIEEIARKFWEEAAVKFEHYPKKADEFAEAFESLDHEYSDGFEDALRNLGVLSESIRQESEKAASFLADCNSEILLFTAPSDRPQKMARVDAAIAKMKRVNNSVEILSGKVRAAKAESDRKAEEARRQKEREEAYARLREAFNTEVKKFDAARATWMADVSALIDNAHNKQAARKSALVALLGEIAGARDRRDFGEIASFSKRIEDARAKRLAVAKDEDMLARKVMPELVFSYVDDTLGAAWAKKMKKDFAGLGDAAATVDVMVAKFEQEVVDCFCAVGTRRRTLEKALENARSLADGVRYNHDVKSVRPKGEPSSGTEIDLLSQCDTALGILIRAQRKATQPTR